MRFASLFKGRLIPALVVVVPLILASLSILLLTHRIEEQKQVSVQEPQEELPDERRDSRERRDSGEQEKQPPKEKDEGLSDKEIPDKDQPDKEKPEEKEVRGIFYLVIDDVGYETQNLNRFLSLPIPVTYAVLPGLSGTELSVETIEEHGAEYILHQPMEPVGTEDPGPGALYTKMDEKEIQEILGKNLKQMPNARGINNHMGSKATSDAKIMKSVLSMTKEKGLFYLDSKTTAESVVKRVAQQEHVDFTERHVFLDNNSTKEYISGALEEAKAVADLRGYAVLIGHIWSSELYEVLKEEHTSLRQEGFLFGHITDLFYRETADAGSWD
ncbi:MAG: divergent polysaccharide deacetylase family protein [Spirochaetaceae bacterium]